MTTPIEQCARAIARVMSGSIAPGTADDVVVQPEDIYAARACLTALLDNVSEEMVRSTDDISIRQDDGTETCLFSEEAEEIFTAMIRAAIEERNG